MTTSLLTDRYELTMLRAALADGTAYRHSTFEVFTRNLPPGRRYGVVAGTGRLLEALADFRFDDDDLAWLSQAGVVDRTTLDFLAKFRFRGTIHGYPEGETYVAASPVLTVTGTFAECVLLETLVLSILNHDSAVAAAASRMTSAAVDRPCIEMGSRRTHEEAAVAAARAAVIAGFGSTSNLEAGRRYDLETTGTSAHAFTLLHDDEQAAFAGQIAALGPQTTLLVDTYDVAAGVRRAIDVAGTSLGAVRIDSGDLGSLAVEVRRQLDSLGARDTKIVVTSDLDEHAIAALAVAPVDAYGVGTRLVTGSGHPTCGMVYKLVAREASNGMIEPVEKTSPSKASRGGRKTANRVTGIDGRSQSEVLLTGHEDAVAAWRSESGQARALQVPLVLDGAIDSRWTGPYGVRTAASRHERSRAELPRGARRLSDGDPVIPTVNIDLG
ncbi:nicotinate phosphoribosyltransferase [Paraoerskovia marina]|uniref:Nicotinate phosphoribosyltransferase n=2 Tax=Paraoerskovia marina TaxID=545619 RepID=A0A1H1UEA2_9CELL|nr:nicotinate phosphoribosyltransferase [Paraoerskovia marina]